MILFCDTSALVKLYVDEPGSGAVAAEAASAEAIAVSRIAWVEAMAAFARRVREHPADADAIEQARDALRAQWSDFLVVECDQAVVERAGDHAEAFALRAYDAVQLATLDELHRSLPGEVRFACADRRLLGAARVLGIETA